MIGVSPIGVRPIASAGNESPPALALSAVLLRTTADLVYLVDIYPYQEGAAEIGAGLGGLSVGPMCALKEDVEAVDNTPAWNFSDRGWVSNANDNPAHTYFEGRARVPLVIDRQIPIAPEQARRLTVQYGTIDLYAGDGLLDDLVARSAIDGRRARVRVKEYDAPLSDAGTIFDGSGVRWAIDDDQLRLTVRDNGYLLEVRLQQNTYGGTGGADGNDAVAGMVKPLCYGRPRNITPIPINPTSRVYQFHDGAVQGVDAVYDRGAALDFDADYPTYDALVAAAIPAGKYGTCLAQGLIRLGLPPFGLVTADVQGGKNAAGAFIERSGEIALHLIRVNGGLPETRIQASAFSSLDAIAPYDVDWYWPQPITVAEALNQLLAGVSAWWGPKRDGRISVGRLDAPSPTASTLTLTAVEILDLERIDPPQGVFPPSWRRRVAYDWNWTVQREDIESTAITDERRQYLAEPFRVADNADPPLRIKFLLATDPDVLPARFRTKTAAQNEADRLQGIFGTGREMFAARVKFIGHLVDIEHTIRVVWPRFGLSAGKFFRVVGMREECDRREITLILWG